MAREIAYWIAAAVLGGAGGVLYWLVADRGLGISDEGPEARMLIGAVVLLAARGAWRLRRRR